MRSVHLVGYFLISMMRTRGLARLSRVQAGVVNERVLHFIRDDLLTLTLVPGMPGVTGNKARKFAELHRAISNSPGVKHKLFASYGGPQSNSMLALSYMVRAARALNKDCRFVYFTKKLPAFLSINRDSRTPSPTSNLGVALQNGMQLREIPLTVYNELVASPKTSCGFPKSLVSTWFPDWEADTCYWVPQGGAFAEAEDGVRQLVDELAEFISTEESSISSSSSSSISSAGSGKNRPWKLIIASGTGTTALFAARCVSRLRLTANLCEVIAIPCIGSRESLLAQMAELDLVSGDCRVFPTVLGDSEDGRARIFANPYAEHLGLWKSLRAESGIDFDLVYAPRAWEILLASQVWKDDSARIIYYCCGGAEGTESQLGRYRHAGYNITQ